jgi:ABC-type transport system involved in multi-copper enzyme maturation permease subunit
MRLLEIARFEIAYQARRPWTWLYFAVLLALSLQIVLEAYTGGARDGGYAFNSPFVITSITVLTGAMGLLVSAALAGDAGARDVQTRMHPLLYTTPTSRRAYLTGRFLAAFVLNALVLTSVQLALLLSAVMPGLEPDLLGPFRPAAYLGAYFVYALPTAFATTALLFSLAALGRRAIASYLGAVLLFFASMFVWFIVAQKLQQWELARLLDPLGLTILSEISRGSTAAEKNVLATFFTRSLFLNRALWVGIAIGVLALTQLRFRFEHATPGGWWSRRAEARDAAEAVGRPTRREPVVVPHVARTFGVGTQASQLLAIAAQSFGAIAFSWGGLVLVALSTLLVLLGPTALAHLGVPLVPTTQQVTSFIGNDGEILWTIVPLLTVFYVGELVWRERDAGLHEIADATPAPEWVRVTGRFAGFALVLVGYQLLLVVACLLIQTQLGYRDFEIGLYLRIVLGLLLAEHLLFALLAFTVHVLVNQKYVGHMIALMAYAFTAFGAAIGVEHHLLVYGSDPGWQYSDLRGFGPSVAPWAWFKLYWAAWALLLAVAAKLFWVRGREQGLSARLRSARQRLTRSTVGVAAAAASIVVVAGGFVLYNTTVLNAYETGAERTARRVAYERRYARFDGAPQPQLTGTTLHVEIYPRRREVEIRGRYHLVNATGAAIDSIHLSPEAGVETGPAQLDRPATLVVDDTVLRHRIYALGTPLLPGDSMRLGFTVRFRPRGFTNDAADQSVTRSATHFDGNAWLPALGYQRGRELAGTGARRVHGLPPRRGFRSLDDVAARTDRARRRAHRLRGDRRHRLGAGRRRAGRAAPPLDRARAELLRVRDRRTDPERLRHLLRRLRGARGDVARYGPRAAAGRDPDPAPPAPRREPRPHGGRHTGVARLLHGGVRPLPARPAAVRGAARRRQLAALGAGERRVRGGLRALRSRRRSARPGLSVRGHGARDRPRVVGAPAASRARRGRAAAQREPGVVLRDGGRGADARPRSAGSAAGHDARGLPLAARPRRPPLLRSTDGFVAYRKGPFAMHALREYVGADRVNVALRRLLQQYGGARPPLPTARDLYRELQAVTPDSLHYLLVDLFEANTYWELETRRVAAERVAPGSWRVTLDVNARKEVVDSAGAPRALPMNDLVEIGVYAEGKDGQRGAPLYLRLHRIRTGAQRITVTVPRQPASAGIDPRHLLIDVDTEDNVGDVAESAARSPTR